MNENQRYQIKRTTVDAYILYCLMDGKIHKREELASKADISTRSVQRSIERLGVYFTIHTFRGGERKGGIFLDPRHLYYNITKEREM